VNNDLILLIVLRAELDAIATIKVDKKIARETR
jgi:hypothetical protein